MMDAYTAINVWAKEMAAKLVHVPDEETGTAASVLRIARLLNAAAAEASLPSVRRFLEGVPVEADVPGPVPGWQPWREEDVEILGLDQTALTGQV
jgi:hypothetical protein